MQPLYPELPIKVNLICIHKNADTAPQVLLLKRIPEDGGFWQTLTETLEIDESLLQCIHRGLREEIGIEDETLYEIIQEVHRFSWTKKDYTVVELVYLVRLYTRDITLSSEHTEYQWVDVSTAIDIVDKDNNKISLEKAWEVIS